MAITHYERRAAPIFGQLKASDEDNEGLYLPSPPPPHYLSTYFTSFYFRYSTETANCSYQYASREVIRKIWNGEISYMLL